MRISEILSLLVHEYNEIERQQGYRRDAIAALRRFLGDGPEPSEMPADMDAIVRARELGLKLGGPYPMDAKGRLVFGALP